MKDVNWRERLGQLAVDGNESAAAQEKLIPFLEAGCGRARWFGAKYLYAARDAGKATQETEEALKAFEDNPENQEFVDKLGNGQAAKATTPAHACCGA